MGANRNADSAPKKKEIAHLMEILLIYIYYECDTPEL